MKTIGESNKLIAEFMQAKNEISDVYYLPEFGHYFNSYGQIEWNECFRSNELKYHTSWDWLMPVVERIANVKGFHNIKANLLDLKITANISDVYSAVISFIEWYNYK